MRQSGSSIRVPLTGGIALCCVLLPVLAAEPGATAPVVDFDREIRPILSNNCFSCHGPDEKKRQFELRLDTSEGPFRQRSLGGPVIVPGDSSSSILYRRISSDNTAWKMPPASSGRVLTDRQIDLIKSWIDQGAGYQPHWSFQSPVRPPLPEVDDESWPRNPIDRFVLAELEKRSAPVSPEADRETLIRRVSYDLTGLPPSVEEVDAFLQDDSEDAYEKVVDRLLGSPHYGERMAVDWLDLARYADTHGYNIDSGRDMWLWRDWVIEAFNHNIPFDEFTIEQLAGDLLPDPTQEQLIATGFNRNHMINFGAGALSEEYLHEYVADRVNTTATVWMGLTLTCAQCHDHKYDPLSQLDYYRFYGFFNNVDEDGLDGRGGNARPLLRVPSHDQRRREAELEAQIARAEDQLEKANAEQLFENWLPVALTTLPPVSHPGLVAHYEFDGHFADTSGHYHHAKPSSEFVKHKPGRVGQSIGLDGETFVDLGDAARFSEDEAFTIALWIEPGGNAAGYVLSRRDPSKAERGYGIFLGEEVVRPPVLLSTPLSFRLIQEAPDRVLSVSLVTPLANFEWHHLAILYDGSRKASGVRLFVNGEPQEVRIETDRLEGPVQTDRRLYLGVNPDFPFTKRRNGTTARIDDLRFYERQIQEEELEELVRVLPVRSILQTSSGDRTEGQVKELRGYFLENQTSQSIGDTYRQLQAARRELEELRSRMPSTMIMREREEARKTFVLERGDYRRKGTEVQPGVPACLPAMSSKLPRNRLGLARWLVREDHPLTSRVAVNRFWQSYFGSGLVKTSEDFGSQGSPPSHPALLDWLAREFVESGWDVKAMQRLIVTSATYRQSSKMTSWSREHDPENRWLSHASRLRFPAEMIRDGILAVSGLLNLEIGGPGVFPYQPAGLWKEVAYGETDRDQEYYTAQVYRQSTGPDLYRRSLYTFWKRAVPPPGLAMFDAPDRESCTVRRSRTNTPLQPLVLLNDTSYVEAARALATRTLGQVREGSRRRLQQMFQMATARRPTNEEVRILEEALQRQQDFYTRRPEAAMQFLEVGASPTVQTIDPGELAAWTALASIVLNLDETITRE